MTLLSLIDPEVWTVLFSVLGIVVGYVIRRQQGEGVPSALVGVLRELAAKRRQQEAARSLQALLLSSEDEKTEQQTQKQEGAEKA